MGRSGFSYVTGVVLALAVAGSSVAFGAAEVGEKAPPLKIRQWIKGKPITLAQGRGKNVFIVEFWATWCGPCKVTIPHLSHLQKRFADQGVVVVGISDEAPAAARPFVEKQEKMNYRVACDDGRKTIGAYLKRGSGIPQAFVVDKAGVVVWQGHPMGGLERVVEQVAAGTFDAKVQAKKERLREDALSALRRGDGTEGLRLIDQLIAADPKDPASYDFKLKVLAWAGRLDEAAALREQMAKTFTDNAYVLNDLATHYAAAEDLSQRDPERALRLASRAVILTKGEDPAILDTLARVHYALCDIDRAIETQQKSVAAASGSDKAKAQAVLDYYLKVKAIGEKTASADRASAEETGLANE